MTILLFILKQIKRLLIKYRKKIGVMFITGLLVNEFSRTFYEIAKLSITLQDYNEINLISQISVLLFLLAIFSYLNKALLTNRILIFTVFGSNITYNIISNLY